MAREIDWPKALEKARTDLVFHLGLEHNQEEQGWLDEHLDEIVHAAKRDAIDQVVVMVETDYQPSYTLRSIIDPPVEEEIVESIKRLGVLLTDMHETKKETEGE